MTDLPELHVKRGLPPGSRWRRVGLYLGLVESGSLQAPLPLDDGPRSPLWQVLPVVIIIFLLVAAGVAEVWTLLFGGSWGQAFGDSIGPMIGVAVGLVLQGRRQGRRHR
jgi:hypothetical protein